MNTTPMPNTIAPPSSNGSLARVRSTTLSFALILTAVTAGCGEDDATAETASNRDVARDAVVLLAEGDVDAISDHFAEDFVDHETGTNGSAALRESTLAARQAHPEASTEVFRVVSEGDQVFVHSHLTLEPGTLGIAVADIFRLEDGLIVEHWGNEQEVPATTASGNDMFSTLSSPQRLDPDPQADASETHEVMNALGVALVVDKDLGAWDRFVEAPYYQHSTNTPNGVEAVKEIWGPIIADPSVIITPVLSLAEGDLYVTMNLIESPTMNLTTVDVSRVRGGLILEHWDVVAFEQ